MPRTALQFAPCSGATVGQQLVSHDAVDAVILTGGTATALDMLARKPTLRLLAETGGKNATIVTALSDRDQAIKNVLHCAFTHSGQKCSATSLAILEEEVYHDARFRETLVDAVESLSVGSAWRLSTKVGPLIRPPSGALERGLKELEPGESWAVRPQLHVDDNPHLVSPGVKWGVQPREFTHCTELFGPVLGVMPARDLHEAIDLVNATGYGLTSGLESLDDREHRLWQEGVRAGNLYINRPTTGAIVLRQPFGGMGKSAFGPGIKAGGPNYVAPLMQFADLTQQRAGSSPTPVNTSSPTPANSSSPTPVSATPSSSDDFAFPSPSLNLPRESFAQRRQHLHALRDSLATVGGALRPADNVMIRRALESYLHWCLDEFESPHDHFRLIGEDNYRRYLPVADLRIRIHADDSAFDVLARVAAARTAGCRMVISSPPDLPESVGDVVQLLDDLTDSWAGAIEFLEESDAQLADAIGWHALSPRRAWSETLSYAPRPSQTQGVPPIGRIRYAAPDRVPELIRRAAHESFVYIADAPPIAHGRIELLWYFREQSLSHIYHRYGNLGRRAEEPRAPVI